MNAAHGCLSFFGSAIHAMVPRHTRVGTTFICAPVSAHQRSRVPAPCPQELTRLPPWLPALPSLSSLDVSSNRLGSLPPGLGGAARLRSLQAASNQLTDLPLELCQ